MTVGRLALTLGVLACVATASAGQFRGGFRTAAPRFPTSESFGHGFNFCRAMYTSVRREDGGQGWSTDYPGADAHFSIRLSELTKTRISREPGGAPDHLVVQLTDEGLFQCPFIQMSDVGTADFSDSEAAALRAYLLKGGFLWVDDFWGTDAWNAWTSALARVLPPSEFPTHELLDHHPVFRTMYDVDEVPQIPSIQFWRRSGTTAERASDSVGARMLGISDRRGHLMVLMTHNTDVADAWERENEDPDFFYRFSPVGYALGVNVLLYAMTH
jgi:hypothetical protein